MSLTERLKGRWFGDKDGDAQAKSMVPQLDQPTPYPRVSFITAEEILDYSAAYMFRTQPQLRLVITFLARNGAHCAVQEFDRISSVNRVRLTDTPAAMVLKRPNPNTTSYELIRDLISDLMLYDDAYWWVGKSSDSPSGWNIVRIPPEWVVGATYTDLWSVDEWIIQPILPQVSLSSQRQNIPAANILHFHGWNPSDPRFGCSPVQALKEILAEQVSAQRYRKRVWDKGPQMSGIIQRPVEAPAWDDKHANRFNAYWQDQFRADGPRAGGVPLLEDGMTYQQVGFSPTDNQYVENAQLTLSTVCSVYHVNPTMVGDTDNASYSSVKEFRKMLYGDTLGPLFAELEDRITNFLLPIMGEKDTAYVEFNIAEKMQGDFTEQATAIQIATGRPWMLTEEARSMMNYPPLDEENRANLLAVPMNYEFGSAAPPVSSGAPGASGDIPDPQASPTDTAPAIEDRTGPGDSQAEQQPKALESFFQRQQASILSKMGAGVSAIDAWDIRRWDKELTEVVGDPQKALIINETTRQALEDVRTLDEARDVFIRSGLLAAQEV